MNELSSVEMEELKVRLEELLGELERQLSVADDGTATVDLSLPIGRLSRMDAMQQQSMAKANRRDHEVRLQQVRLALTAMADGDYGACVRCEEPIAHARLVARPEARFCVPCQEKIEARR